MNHDERADALQRALPEIGVRAATGPKQDRATTLWREIAAHSNIYAALIRGKYLTRGHTTGMPPQHRQDTPGAFAYVAANTDELDRRSLHHWRRLVKDWHRRADKITEGANRG